MGFRFEGCTVFIKWRADAEQLGNNNLFLCQVSKCGIIEAVLSWAKFKAQNQLNTKCSGKKQNKLKGKLKT